MNRTTRFLAPASLAIGRSSSSSSPKQSHWQMISRRQLNTTVGASLLPAKPNVEICTNHQYMDKLDCCELSNERTDVVVEAVESQDDISCAFQKMQVSNAVDENVNNLEVDLNAEAKKSAKKPLSGSRDQYRDIRRWKKLQNENSSTSSTESFTLRLLSFNILAQDLLETHSYLYRDHDKAYLPWEGRKLLLTQEILEADAHIACLQEMQEQHLTDFLQPFEERGYTHVYKKCTNQKNDGLLLLYKKTEFELLELSKVEYYQTDVELLSRNNVGLVAKFALKDSPETKFVIATTHLLYNPRRNDVRLAQVQLLFAEIERISFIEDALTGPRYHPIILSGDFNLEPNSGVYKFIMDGAFEFKGKGRNLERSDLRYLTNNLIPSRLYVTDECQHYDVLSKRLSRAGSGRSMLRNSESSLEAPKDDASPPHNPADTTTANPVDVVTTTYQKVEIAEGHFVTFSSGLLTHPFKFSSVYGHKRKGGGEATTYQDRWITVDYIFYSDVRPIERLALPNAAECAAYLPTIPNAFVGSDHLCLGATFQLQRKR